MTDLRTVAERSTSKTGHFQHVAKRAPRIVKRTVETKSTAVIGRLHGSYPPNYLSNSGIVGRNGSSLFWRCRRSA
jgi:hypothetical protein